MNLRNLVLALAIITPAPAFASPVATEAFCTRDLSSTESRLRQALARLTENRNAPIPQRCEIFRRHVQVMQHAAMVYDRCTTGRTRQENVGQMLGSIADWREIIARNCR